MQSFTVSAKNKLNRKLCFVLKGGCYQRYCIPSYCRLQCYTLTGLKPCTCKVTSGSDAQSYVLLGSNNIHNRNNPLITKVCNKKKNTFFAFDALPTFTSHVKKVHPVYSLLFVKTRLNKFTLLFVLSWLGCQR